MADHAKIFNFFWAEVKRPFLLGCAKTTLLFPILILVSIAIVRAMQCAGWMGEESQKVIACSEILVPEMLLARMVAFLPKLLISTVVGLPFLFLGILYLEWLKYKQDKPSGFGVYLGWTVPNGSWMRSNFERLVSGQAWEKYPGFKLDRISDSENHLSGHFSDEEVIKMVKSASRRFTSFLRKPTVETADGSEWHIHASSGEELKLKLERIHNNLGSDWILTACLFEWVGRNQPVRLHKTHSTHFLVTPNAASAPEGMDSAAGELN